MALGWAEMAVEAEALSAPRDVLATEVLRLRDGLSSVARTGTGGTDDVRGEAEGLADPALRALVCAPGRRWSCSDATTIFRCEGGDWLGVGDAGERGGFQLHPVHAWRFLQRGWTWDDAFIPKRNVEIAYEIWVEQGWHPWTCRYMLQ